MFSKSLIAFVAIVAASGAIATPTRRNAPASQCNTAPVQCCDTSTTSSNPTAASILQSIGVVLGADIPVGLTCTPITVVGAGSGAVCNASPLCCENNKFAGLIAIGCTPVDLSL
ncbi:fungal hydrophobin [Gloeopeniophorella convolvens]|nr:fungal hydrophobin [Gloeopeniophorella convolvens]